MQHILKAGCILFLFLALDTTSIQLGSARDRNQYLWNLNATVEVHKALTNDSAVLIHYKAALFLIKKSGKDVVVSEMLYVRKRISGKEIIIKRLDFISHGLTTLISLPGFTFERLFDLKKSPNGGHIAARNYHGPINPLLSTAYFQSIYNNDSGFVEIPWGLLDDVQFQKGLTVQDFLNTLLDYTSHWSKLEALVRKNGPGKYRMGIGASSLDFTLTKTGRFIVFRRNASDTIRNLPRL